MERQFLSPIATETKKCIITLLIIMIMQYNLSLIGVLQVRCLKNLTMLYLLIKIQSLLMKI